MKLLILNLLESGKSVISLDAEHEQQEIAYDTDIDEGEYQRLRGRAIRDMKRTNGRISFKDALDFQKSV